MDERQASELEAQLRLVLRELRRRQPVVDGLSGSAVRVLHAVSKAEGPVRPGDLAAALDMASSNVAAALRELEAQDCVRRERDTADARRSNLTLTDRGVGVVSALRAERAEWLRSAVNETLDPAEQDVLVAAGRMLARLASRPS
jgi:DNA-binding MarR family transcriptional regulator